MVKMEGGGEEDMARWWIRQLVMRVGGEEGRARWCRRQVVEKKDFAKDSVYLTLRNKFSGEVC